MSCLPDCGGRLCRTGVDATARRYAVTRENLAAAPSFAAFSGLAFYGRGVTTIPCRRRIALAPAAGVSGLRRDGLDRSAHAARRPALRRIRARIGVFH